MLDGVIFQGEVGHDPLKATIFLLQVLHPLNVADNHTTVPGFPIVKRGLANAMFPANILNRFTGFLLVKNRDNLGLRKSSLFHD